MNLFENLISIFITILVISGAYQVYLIPQKITFRTALDFTTPIDDLIPFRPRWVWVYSMLYYPFFFSVILTLDDFRHYAFVITSFMLLLIFQLILAFIFPVKTPPSWRDFDPQNSRSEKLLSSMQTYDKGGNCFPSMHVGVVSLSSFHIWANSADWLGLWIYLVVFGALLISASTVLIKQHVFVDIPAGFALAGVVFLIFLQIY